MQLNDELVRMAPRLEVLAQNFHRRHDKSVAFRKFTKKAHDCSKQRARRYAAHVAAWIAYGPPTYVPGQTELKLLHDFLLKLGGGQLPARLEDVLPRTQSTLEGMSVENSSCRELGEKLKERLRHFQCCRGAQTHEKNKEAHAVVNDEDEDEEESCHVVEVESSEEDCQESQTSSLQDAGLPAAEVCQGPHFSSQQLFNKMNEWTNTPNDARLKYTLYSNFEGRRER